MVGGIETATHTTNLEISHGNQRALVTGTPKNGESRAPILPEITLNRTKALLIGNKSKDLLFTGRPRGKAIRQANVRHKSAQMNLDRYARLFESDEVDLAHRVDPMMSETPCHENATKVTRLTLVQVIPNLKPFANQWNESVAPAGFEPATHGLGNRVIYEEEEDEEEEP